MSRRLGAEDQVTSTKNARKLARIMTSPTKNKPPKNT